MTEKKYGALWIADEVIAIIASIAASEIDGVSSMSGGVAKGIASMLGKKDLGKGVRVKVEDSIVKIDLYMILNYDYSIPDLAWQIQANVKKMVEVMTGLQVVEVNVHVQGVEFSDMTNLTENIDEEE
ncbi:MAG: Asp23/Gls24 family envelope stress response protein [Bacillota bacterium]